MAIDVKGLSHILTRGENVSVGNGVSAETTAPRKSAPTISAERVSFTDTAKLLREIHSLLAEVPVVDPQRVEAAQAAISDGSYRIDDGQTATKFIRLESGMVG